MRRITLILFCLTLTTAFAFAADYKLIQVQMLDGGSDGKALPIVYVLLHPDNTRPTVFQQFGSQNMEARLSSLPKGSVVHYDANGFLPAVDAAQLAALKTACEKKGVGFMQSAVN